MLRFVLILGVLFTAYAAWKYGRVTAIGFAAGAFIAYLSFRSLNKAVQALAARIVEAHRPENGFSLVHGFFLRYLLAGGVAYVIFTSSLPPFRRQSRRPSTCDGGDRRLLRSDGQRDHRAPLPYLPFLSGNPWTVHPHLQSNWTHPRFRVSNGRSHCPFGLCAADGVLLSL